MPDRPISMEARQALFCACAVAIATGATEVTTRRLAAAVLGTIEVQIVCTAAGVSAGRLEAIVDLDAGQSYVEVLESIARSLAARSDHFGSRSHIDSVQPLPLAKHVQRPMLQVTETLEASGRGLNAVGVLHAVLLSDSELADEFATRGLAAEILRKHVE